MKNTVLIFALSLTFMSCSTNKCIEIFMRKEVQENKKNNIISILCYEKRKNNQTLDIYSDNNIIEHEKKICNTYNKLDYEYLKNKHKNLSKIEYWTKENQTRFSLDSIVDVNKIEPYLLSKYGKMIDIRYYVVSEPIYLKNKNTTLFSFYSLAGRSRGVEDALIVMKKEKGKWVVLEKVHSQVSH
jgi:hypothetical protein